MEAFCNNKLFFITSTQLQMFLVDFKAVSEPPVPQHVQRKEHVFLGVDTGIDLGFE